jgi:hypothetical protein
MHGNNRRPTKVPSRRPRGADSVEPAQLNGRSNKETWAQLKVFKRTGESRRHHIMGKMNFASLSDLVRFAGRTNRQAAPMALRGQTG